MKKGKYSQANVDQYKIDAQRQIDHKLGQGRPIDRFSTHYGTILDNMNRLGFDPNSSLGKRVMRSIEQGHADWDLDTIRGHGKPVTVKGIFDETGKIEAIDLKNKREVSKWGRYENALKKARKGDTDALKPFVGKSYFLADGTKKEFITDFETLHQLDRAEQLPSGDEISLSSRAA
jgi:hypothetical protein